MDFDNSTDTITPDFDDILRIGGTGAVKIPSGTTAQRPISSSGYELRFNTDDNLLELNVASTWQPLSTLYGNSIQTDMIATHGFPNRTSSSMYFVDATRIFTLSAKNVH